MNANERWQSNRTEQQHPSTSSNPGSLLERVSPRRHSMNAGIVRGSGRRKSVNSNSPKSPHKLLFILLSILKIRPDSLQIIPRGLARPYSIESIPRSTSLLRLQLQSRLPQLSRLRLFNHYLSVINPIISCRLGIHGIISFSEISKSEWTGKSLCTK